MPGIETSSVGARSFSAGQPRRSYVTGIVPPLTAGGPTGARTSREAPAGGPNTIWNVDWATACKPADARYVSESVREAPGVSDMPAAAKSCAGSIRAYGVVAITREDCPATVRR